jgi:hypothetical protein
MEIRGPGVGLAAGGWLRRDCDWAGRGEHTTSKREGETGGGPRRDGRRAKATWALPK